MPQISCPKGHDSSDADFCSVCGTKIPIHPAQSEAVFPPLAMETACPDCGTRHASDSGDFCEICGFNFSTGAHGELKPAPPLLPTTPEIGGLQIIVSADASLRAPESPEPPPGLAPFTITLGKESNLIGRTSDRRAVFPEIALDTDDAVSHRHALLNKVSGGLVLRDLGSSNGTRLNGTGVEPLADVPVKAGDDITLGHWTRLHVQDAT